MGSALSGFNLMSGIKLADMRQVNHWIHVTYCIESCNMSTWKGSREAVKAELAVLSPCGWCYSLPRLRLVNMHLIGSSDQLVID